MFIKKKTKKLKKELFFRTVGDMSTAAVDSYAATISEVVGEIRLSTISERGARLTINVLKQHGKKKTTRVL
jgi:hypothetical protein